MTSLRRVVPRLLQSFNSTEEGQQGGNQRQNCHRDQDSTRTSGRTMDVALRSAVVFLAKRRSFLLTASESCRSFYYVHQGIILLGLSIIFGRISQVVVESKRTQFIIPIPEIKNNFAFSPRPLTPEDTSTLCRRSTSPMLTTQRLSPLLQTRQVAVGAYRS